jgi:hypothetical protein
VAVDKVWDVVEVADKEKVRAEAEWAVPSPEDLAVIARVRPADIQFPIPPVHRACQSNARNAERR